MSSSQELCLACGLCCDGTLFDGVQLETGDDAKHLKALGLPVTVSRGRQPIARFAQPCAALCENRTCKLYTDRPRQCRTFECGVFKKTRTGEMETTTALRHIAKARRQAEKIRRLLRQLGDTDEHRSIGERFHRMECHLEAAPRNETALAIFADLSLAVHRFKLLAHEQFYTRADESLRPT